MRPGFVVEADTSPMATTPAYLPDIATAHETWQADANRVVAAILQLRGQLVGSEVHGPLLETTDAILGHVACHPPRVDRLPDAEDILVHLRLAVTRASCPEEGQPITEDPPRPLPLDEPGRLRAVLLSLEQSLPQVRRTGTREDEQAVLAAIARYRAALAGPSPH
jgi:hypothetical protein